MSNIIDKFNLLVLNLIAITDEITKSDVLGWPITRKLHNDYDKADKALTKFFEQQESRVNKAEQEVIRLKACLHHIGYQKPTSSIDFDWHKEWQNLRNEAREAIKEK